MANKHMDRVNQAYFDIIKAGYLEDRREYDLQLLAASYPDFKSSEIELLERLIQANFYVWKNRDDLLDGFAEQLAIDIQIDIDSHDVPESISTREWLRLQKIESRLEETVQSYRTHPN